MTVYFITKFNGDCNEVRQFVLFPNAKVVIAYTKCDDHSTEEWVSLGDVTAHGRVQDWPSRERLGTRGPFRESPGNFTGPKSNIQIEI